jgi:hypothetical protein
MNLIGNCCISSFIEKMAGLKHENPFTWITLDFYSFYNLITNYSNINWNNYELIRSKHPKYDTYVYDILIENKIKIRYFHYLFDPKMSSIQIKGAEVRYCKIWEYIIQKYEERIKRMIKSNENPIFITEWETLDYNEKNFWKIEKLNLNYKLVVITNNKELKTKNKKILIIYDSHTKGDTKNDWMPGKFAQTYYKQIINFIKQK